jgi:hypothetical protein
MRKPAQDAAMQRTSAELRRRHRRILVGSFSIAVLFHAALILWSPVLEPAPGDGFTAESDLVNAPFDSPWVLDVLFGPPTLAAENGTRQHEPGHRRLETVRVVEAPAVCTDRQGSVPTQFAGAARLRVNGMGHATVVEVTESTGTACGDELVTEVAGALHYHWLPTPRFPAPVDVLQPVTVEIH